MFDGVFVPGSEGQAVASTWGYRPGEIATGLLGADPSLFYPGPPLETRPREVTFVGQLIPRKNVLGAAKAFIASAAPLDGWQLRIVGSGELEAELPGHQSIVHQGFVQPPDLAYLLRQSRCLVLPSLEEHWGLVVHEAALCGCAVLLSDRVGAASDLGSGLNALSVRAGDQAGLVDAFNELSEWSDKRWNEAGNASLSLSRSFGPARFTAGVKKLADRSAGR
jgi:glycosyltransferase involved in cell wall biosynthesis